MLDSITFFRVIKTGFVNYWRNAWLSLGATMIMVVTLVIFSTLAFLFAVTRYSVDTIQDRVDVSVYFKTGVAEVNIKEFITTLEKDSKIKSIQYVSAGTALQNFKSKHAGDPLILESLAELSDNPLPATVQIKANNLTGYPAITSGIQNGSFKDFLSKVNFEDNQLLIERLSRALKLIIIGGLVLVGVFSVIAVLVIFNTITLTIYNRKEEVEIMRLVGATNGYIRGPFVIEALLYSLVATAITTSILYFSVKSRGQYLLSYITDNTSSTPSLEAVIPFASWTYVVLALLVVSLPLSITSSMFAVRKYLKI